MTATDSDVSHPDLTIVPANEASWDDLQTVFGTRGGAARCFCQRFKLARGESFGGFPAEERAHRLREQTDCGHPESDRTSGLVAYQDGEPVAWCAVEPRPAYGGLVRNIRIPWEGRDEDKTDETVWAVTCILTRAGFRKSGIGRALVAAAVEFARSRGARALEGYPINTKDVITEELLVGTVGMFADAGFTEVSHPTLRRVVMRIDF
jgi:GNAT superfamily N-acetyltransferase